MSLAGGAVGCPGYPFQPKRYALRSRPNTAAGASFFPDVEHARIANSVPPPLHLLHPLSKLRLPPALTWLVFFASVASPEVNRRLRYVHFLRAYR